MHTIELMDEALAIAAELGYSVRQEWLDGAGGACEIEGKRWLFVDLSLTANEQLGQVIDAIRCEPGVETMTCSLAMHRKLGRRRSA